MPVCSNCGNTTLKDRQIYWDNKKPAKSPRGQGLCAACANLGDTETGTDGETYKVITGSNGKQRWQKVKGKKRSRSPQKSKSPPFVSKRKKKKSTPKKKRKKSTPKKKRKKSTATPKKKKKQKTDKCLNCDQDLPNDWETFHNPTGHGFCPQCDRIGFERIGKDDCWYTVIKGLDAKKWKRNAGQNKKRGAKKCTPPKKTKKTTLSNIERKKLKIPVEPKIPFSAATFIPKMPPLFDFQFPPQEFFELEKSTSKSKTKPPPKRKSPSKSPPKDDILQILKTNIERKSPPKKRKSPAKKRKLPAKKRKSPAKKRKSSPQKKSKPKRKGPPSFVPSLITPIQSKSKFSLTKQPLKKRKSPLPPPLRRKPPKERRRRRRSRSRERRRKKSKSRSRERRKKDINIPPPAPPAPPAPPKLSTAQKKHIKKQAKQLLEFLNNKKLSGEQKASHIAAFLTNFGISGTPEITQFLNKNVQIKDLVTLIQTAYEQLGTNILMGERQRREIFNMMIQKLTTKHHRTAFDDQFFEFLYSGIQTRINAIIKTNDDQRKLKIQQKMDNDIQKKMQKITKKTSETDKYRIYQSILTMIKYYNDEEGKLPDDFRDYLTQITGLNLSTF